MRIAFVITNAPPLIGGLEKICLRLAQELKSRGHEVKIIARFTKERHSLRGYFSDSESAGTFDNEGINTTVLPLNNAARILLFPVFKMIWRQWTFPFAKMLYVTALGKSLKNAVGSADVIHFFGNGAEMLGFAAESVAQKISAKFVVEPALHHGQWGDQWIDRKLYMEADLLLAHTRFEEVVLSEMGQEKERIKVITHGVDCCQDGDANRFREVHHLRGPIVLFLGRKTREKGILRLIQAWPLVLVKHPDANLILAGSGIAKDLQELPPSTFDLENLSEESKQDSLSACDLLCVPSEGESFGMVYFEAWAYRKPVIAIDLPVLQETIGESHGGILVKPDALSLASAINTLLSNPMLRTSMGEVGGLFAKRYAWTEAVESYLHCYQSICMQGL